MRVIVNGLPYFCKKLVKDLNEFDTENTYRFFDTYNSKWEQIKYMLNLPFAGAVISSNGVTDKSKSLDWALRFKKKLIMQWHGTDVLFAIRRNQDKTIDRKYVDYASHIAVAPWFSEELKGVVSEIQYAPFGYVNEFGTGQAYEKFQILTYLPKGKEDFYGWKQIEQLAKDIPDINVTVVGSKGEGLNQLDNVTFLGWIQEEELFKLMCTHPVLLRLTEHDGRAFTILQAIAAGCEIASTYPLEHCYKVSREYEDIFEKIKDLRQLIIDREMKPNLENISYAKDQLNRDIVMRSFTKKIKQILHG